MIPDVPQWFKDELRLAYPKHRLKWMPWEAKPNDESGDDCWSPFGPPVVRATNGDGEVGIRFTWGGRGWEKLNPDAVTVGRWVLYEDVEGQLVSRYDLCGVDTSFKPFDRKMLDALRTKMGDVEFVKRKFREQRDAQSEHEIETKEGRAIVYRNPDGRTARDEAEQQVGELASYGWMRTHGKYQFDPPLAAKGEQKNGFVVVDRRTEPKSYLEP